MVCVIPVVICRAEAPLVLVAHSAPIAIPLAKSVGRTRPPAGMVHPEIIEAAGYDPARYTGFAAGMGVERIAMPLYRVDDIRNFYQNDLRFLSQF